MDQQVPAKMTPDEQRAQLANLDILAPEVDLKIRYQQQYGLLLKEMRDKLVDLGYDPLIAAEYVDSAFTSILQGPGSVKQWLNQ